MRWLLVAFATSLALPTRATSGLHRGGTPGRSTQESGADPGQDTETEDLSRLIADLLPEALEADDLEAARAILSEAVEALEAPRSGGEREHAEFLLTLDAYAERLGSLAEQLRLREAVVETTSRLVSSDHPAVLAAMQNLAITRKTLGDFEGAQELEEAVLEARSRLLPEDHPDLLAAKHNLAATWHALGDLQGARELKASVLEARMRQLPRDHPDVLAAMQNLAVTRFELGDFQGASELQEVVLEESLHLLPGDHPSLLEAKQNLAVTRRLVGDLEGARELEEAVLEARSRLLPSGHPALLAAMHNYAIICHQLADHQAAFELETAVFEALSGLYPSDHLELLAAKVNLGATRRRLGDYRGASELIEAAHEALVRRLPDDHPQLTTAKLQLAATRTALGDLPGALELEEAALASRRLLLPRDHPALLTAQEGLALTREMLGDPAGTRRLVSDVLAGIRARACALCYEAARTAREGARSGLKRLSRALYLSRSCDPDHALVPELLATLEGLRMASVASSEATHVIAKSPELKASARAVAEARSRLNDFVAVGPPESGADDAWRAVLFSLVEERDRAERTLRKQLAETGTTFIELDVEAVTSSLSEGAAAASFLRYPLYVPGDPETGAGPDHVDSLLAFVLLPEGDVHRVDLGPAAELELLVGEWRAALGSPLAGRGVGVIGRGRPEQSLEALGRELRERVLDPILDVAGDPRRLHVVLDDLLFLVPLDALPDKDGELVGKRVTIRHEVTLARLLRERRPISEQGDLVLAGGIDYDAEPGDGARLRLDASTPPIEAMRDRSGPSPTGFAFLPGANTELESIAGLYGDAFEREARTLSGAGCTKAALHACAPNARFLHLATHGWFASEGFKSQVDALGEEGEREAFSRAELILTGFAPETLCGLALSGANRGADALGCVPGILTAEELACFDLRSCELAVLSACETNVGVRRAGQGIQSLQSALHAAGVRTAITSLWKVDDAATRQLMELFYTKLWRDRLGKADALWQAKMALRTEGHPPRDWAGWVLSGAPD